VSPALLPDACAVYVAGVQRFFSTKSKLFAVLAHLASVQCPVCGLTGRFKRHGVIRGYVTPDCRGIRAWRIYCNPKRGGCGHAPSLRVSSVLPHRCLSAGTVWSFLDGLRKGLSIQAAWGQARTGLCVEAAYRLIRSITRHLCELRRRLCARAPPPERCGYSPLVATLEHLARAFPRSCPVRTFQEAFQVGFPGNPVRF
jgi:hypothetical protein